MPLVQRWGSPQQEAQSLLVGGRGFPKARNYCRKVVGNSRGMMTRNRGRMEGNSGDSA